MFLFTFVTFFVLLLLANRNSRVYNDYSYNSFKKQYEKIKELDELILTRKGEKYELMQQRAYLSAKYNFQSHMINTNWISEEKLPYKINADQTGLLDFPTVYVFKVED